MMLLIRIKPLFSSSTQKLSIPKVSRFNFLHLSSVSRPSKLKTQQNQAEASSISSLFDEITEILGADKVIPDKSGPGFLISAETQVRETVSSQETISCTQDVCGNAGERENNFQLGKWVVESDLSSVVHEITKIVRANNDVVLMEEMLDNAGFRVEPEIVENVLKRCYKVPRLAIRFFDWVKKKDGFFHTTATYNTMLYIAGEAQEFKMVEGLVKEMEENSCEKDIRTWTILISMYGEARKIGRALMIFENMRKSGCEPDVAAYKMIIRSLCLSGKGDVALEFYREMIEKEMVLDLKTYKMLLNCVARTEDVQAVWSVADDMVKNCEISEHDVYLCLLKSFCVSGKIREALELIRYLKDREVSLDSAYFETLVKGLCRADRISDAQEIVEIMKRRNLVNANVYGIIINGYLRKNDITKALDLYERMKESGHTPTTTMYTELMQHLFKTKGYQDGCELFNEMLKNGTELDAVSITAMVAGHVRHNRIAEAWRLFNSMEEKGSKPTWKSYSIFVKELCRKSKTEEILKVLNQMQASKIAIGDKIFHWVISCMEKKGEADKIEVVKQIHWASKSYSQEQKVFGNEPSKEELFLAEVNHPPPAKEKLVVQSSSAVSENDVREICRILSSSTDWDSTQKALEESIIQFTPELVTKILHKCVTHGNRALRFFSWIGKKTGYKHTTEAYNMAIKVAGCGKDFKHMRSLYHEMRRNGYSITPNTWAIMIMQYGRSGLTDIALRTFKDMKASGCNPNGPTYKCLITVLCGKKGRNIDEAVKAFQEMIQLGFVPDRGLVEDYLGCLCEAVNLDKAKSCVDALRKIGFSVPLAYSMYIRALCKVGQLEEALSLLDEVDAERSTLERYTYASLVHGLLQRGKLEEALAKVVSMRQMGINPSVHVYTSLIVHFFKEKKVEKALETFQKMREEGCEPSVVTYTAMICGYMNMGKLEDAWNVFQTMKEKGPSPDFKTYSKFINCLCESGRSEDALSLLSEMLDNGISPSTVNFRTVFYGLNREGKQNLARAVLQKKSALIGRRKVST